MESAIPPHLRHQRKCPMTMPDGHRPPFPAWTTRFAAESESIVMACIGVQHQRYPAVSVMKVIADYLSVPQGPAHWDLSSVVDADGSHNLVAIAYWHSTEQFRDWQEKVSFWDGGNPPKEKMRNMATLWRSSLYAHRRLKPFSLISRHRRGLHIWLTG